MHIKEHMGNTEILERKESKWEGFCRFPVLWATLVHSIPFTFYHTLPGA